VYVAWTIEAGLPAIRAAAARHALVLNDLAIKVVLGLDNAAKEHPAIHAGVGALEVGVVSLYGVVMILGGWVRVGCARLCGVHSSVPTFLWAGLRGVLPPAEPSLYPTPALYNIDLILSIYRLKSSRNWRTMIGGVGCLPS
jgi:hypothetical protein